MTKKQDQQNIKEAFAMWLELNFLEQKTGYKYQSYLCTLAYRKRGACTKGRIPRPAFEAAILNQLTEIILTPENVEEMLRLQTEGLAGLASQQSDRRRELLSLISANKKKLKNVVDAIEESGSSPALKTRLADLELESKTLQHDLAQLDDQHIEPPPALTAEELIHYIQRVTEILKGKDDQSKKTLLRGLIANIDVEREGNQLRGTIYVYTPDPEEPPASVAPLPDDVPPSRSPSGPPLRRHIIQYHFKASTKRPR